MSAEVKNPEFQVNFPVTLGFVVDGKDVGTTATAKAKLPEGFVVEGFLVEELEAADNGKKLTIAVGSLSDTITISSSALAKKFAAKTATLLTEDTNVTVVEGSSTPSAMTNGKFRIGIKGFVAFGHTPTTDINNVAVGDPFHAK